MSLTISAVTEWHCPNCGARDQTNEARPHTRMHTCPKLHYLSAPMVQAGTSAKVEAKEREDYVGGETPFIAPNGRPIMSIVTTRDNGTDARVFAPVATNKE